MKPTSIHIPCIGYSLAADWYDGTTDEVILDLPGFTAGKAKYAELLSEIAKKTGAHALSIDYSGHGESPYDIQDVSPAQNFLEVVTAFDWITEYHPGKKITVMGTSYGGFHAAQLTKYREFQKLILRVPAMYPPDIFYTKWGQIDRDATLDYRSNAEGLHSHPVLRRASRFDGKTFVITHELDRMCPQQSTDPFVAAFSADTWEAKGFKHALAESNASQEQKDEYTNRIVQWMTG